MPFFAPTADPTVMAQGVASPSAHGQLITTTLMANSSANSPLEWLNSSVSHQERGMRPLRASHSHSKKVQEAMVSTTGVNFPATASAVA